MASRAPDLAQIGRFLVPKVHNKDQPGTGKLGARQTI